jgi:uncharacterized protein (DUF433 family)
MSKEYVTPLDYEFKGEPRIAYRVAGTRISLDSVIINWLNGETPDSIVESFPSLTLEQVYGTITFYLANRELIDEYLRQGKIEWEIMRAESSEKLRREKPELYHRLMEERKRRGLI